MAGETVILNGNEVQFAELEFADDGTGDIQPGHFLELDANGEVSRHSQETDLDQEGAGAGMMADLHRSDPSHGKSDTYGAGENVHGTVVPIGGRVDTFLAAGGDLDDGTRANVDPSDVLEQVANGAVAEHDGTDTTGDGTGTATETVFDEGALFIPLESADNSGAAAGEQQRIEVVRIA